MKKRLESDIAFYFIVAGTVGGSICAAIRFTPGVEIAAFNVVFNGFLFFRSVVREAMVGTPAEEIKPPAPVKTFDKTGWTPCEYTRPPDTIKPVLIMRDGWDGPSLWERGWDSGKNPYMNVIGLYWRYPDGK